MMSRSKKGVVTYSGLAVVVLLAGCSDQSDGIQTTLATTGSALASDSVVSPPTAQAAGLGRGLDNITEELRDFCIGASSQITDYSNTYSRLYLDAAMSKDQISKSFDVSASLSVNAALLSGNAEFDFKRKTEENGYSIVIAYGAEYSTGSKMLDPMSRRVLVDPLTTPNWYTRCGDYFLAQTDQGGQIFITIRIEFDSKSTKQDFTSKLGFKYSWADVKAAFSSSSEELRGRGTIHVEAFQKGGNVAAIGEVLGAAGAVDCGIGNLSKCDAVVTKVLGYAGSSAFVAGMNEKPASLRYYWSNWRTVLGDAAPATRSVPIEIAPAQSNLRQWALEQAALRDRVRTLKVAIASGQLAATNRFQADLPGFEAAIARNIVLLSEASTRCFEDLDAPISAASLAACANGADMATLVAKGFNRSVTLNSLDPSNGAVIGVVDGIALGHDDWWLSGWTCLRGDPRAIDYEVYSSAGVIARGHAGSQSEAAVNAQCNSDATAFRFSIPLRSLVYSHGGESIRVRGVPAEPGADNADLLSGELTIPRVPVPLAPARCGALRLDEGLQAGQEVLSCDGRLVLSLQADGNLVLEEDLFGSRAVLWASNTGWSGASFAIMQSDGNLVIYTLEGRPVWNSATDGNAEATLGLQDDCNMVVYSASGEPLWATNTNVRAAPLALTAASSSENGNAVELSWPVPSAPWSGFVVARAIDGISGFSSVGTLGASATTFTDVVPPIAGSYTYKVWATNSSGSVSAYSVEAKAISGTSGALIMVALGSP